MKMKSSKRKKKTGFALEKQERTKNK